MRIAKVHLESKSPYSQSRYIDEKRGQKETADDFERRTWKKRIHTTKDGFVFIPPMAFKNCLTEAAKYLSMQVPGKGKATYTKKFTAGVLVTDGLELSIRGDDVKGETYFVPADGIRGSGKRVLKTFPVVPEWSGVVPFYILDDSITEEVFEKHIREAGQFIGIGRFRPINNGFYGRFDVKKIEWMEN